MTIFFAVIFSVVIHEFGHILTARLVKVPLVSFAPKITGLSMQFDFSGVGYIREAFVHLGGSIAGVLSSAVSSLIPCRFCRVYAGISFSLAIINLLPLSVSDGGAALKAIISLFLFPDTVYRVAKIISWITLFFLWTAVLWTELRSTPNLGLLFFICFTVVELSSK